MILNAPDGRLETVRDGDRIWLRVRHICRTLGVHQRTWEKQIERDPSLVPDGHTAMVPWPTDGGEQMIRVYSLDAVMNVAMEIHNKQARAFRRWVLALLRGQAPVRRPEPGGLTRLADARATLGVPTIRAAIAKLDGMAEADAAHQRRQARVRAEATRLAGQHGLSLTDLRKLRDLERILAELPSLGAQAALPLDA
jgi:hypothetical protein